MPATRKVCEKDILEAAIDVIRKDGLEMLSVRNIAKKLNISTQPIYFHFDGMVSLKKRLLDYSRKRFEEITNKAISDNAYKRFGLSFLEFASSEPELFKFLYLRKRKDSEIEIEDINYNKTISLLEKYLELSKDEARNFHEKMTNYCYSLGVMIASGYKKFSSLDLEKELDEMFYILLRYYKHITNEIEFNSWRQKLHFITLEK